MRVSASVRALRTFVRLGFLAIVFVCLAHMPAAAQTPNCGANCAVVFAGDVHDNICYNTNPNEAACPASALSLHISFGQTVDFFQPSGVQLFDAHTASSGSCPGGICTYDSKFRAPLGAEFANTMTSSTDNKVVFDGIDLGGGPLNVGTYPFFCEPHGVSMVGTIIVDPDSTSVNLVADINPSVSGQTVTFTATVSNTTIASIIPTGTVTFKDGGVAMAGGTVALTSGSASFPTSLLSAASHNITAVYNPDVNFSGSTSNTVVENVQDFSIGISNPVGSALPCPGGPTCPAGESYDYTGTLTPINGYTGSATISCQGSTPSSCALVSPTNPVAMNTPFTVRASNTVAASTFNFTIRAASASGFAVSHAAAVSLNVGTFTFGVPNPTSVSVAQGNPSTAIALQVVSQGSFSGEVDMSCVLPLPAGVTCLFGNGSSTHALMLSAGQTVNDTLILNTSGSAAIGGPTTITVQATPAASPSQFQQQAISLTVTAGVNTVQTILYFGSRLAGQTDLHLPPPTGTTNILPVFPAPASPPAGYIPATLPLNADIWGGQFSFQVSASNWNTANADAMGAQLLITFSEPVLSASASVTGGATGGESCGALSGGVSITCNLVTIPWADWTKEVTVFVTPPIGRSVKVTAAISTTSKNTGHTDSILQNSSNVINSVTQTRPRPMVRPGQKPGNTNPK
ncbi:MAG TPA: Ig-like domain repeat protein [Candidatus Angelobacter sp.]|nr:Ig-like domain repeat protein [Candidatus Angelobacter sp.]